MRQEYGTKKIPDFQKTASGKPFFAGENMPFFNLSHSGSFVGCGLHREEIGLDIQKLTPAKPFLVQRVCTDEEQASVKSDLNFCRIWAMKESVGKLTGKGLRAASGIFWCFTRRFIPVLFPWKTAPDSWPTALIADGNCLL